MYNPTCHITGAKDNLKMHAFRNDKGDMTGWMFVHEAIELKGATIKTEIILATKPESETADNA